MTSAPFLSSFKSLAGSVVSVPGEGSFVIDDLLLDCSDWTLVEVAGRMKRTGEARRFALGGESSPLPGILRGFEQSPAAPAFRGVTPSSGGNGRPRSTSRLSGAMRSGARGLEALAATSSRTSCTSPAAASARPDCAPSLEPSLAFPAGDLRSARSLLAGHLWDRKGRIGPIRDLLLDLEARKLRFLAVGDIGVCADTPMLIDVRRAPGLRFLENKSPVRFSIRSISELLAAG